MHDEPLKLIFFVTALICFSVYFVYDLGYDAALDKCKAEAQKIEAERLKQVKDYEEKLQNAMAENHNNSKRIIDYRLNNARLVARLHELERKRREANSAGANGDECGRCEGLLIGGAEVAERCSGLLANFANDRKTLETLQK